MNTEIKVNSEENIKEFLERKTVLKSFPQVVFVELTKNCNLLCKMCERAKNYGNKYNPTLNMDYCVFEKIKDMLFDKVKIIDLHGNGETLCYPYILKVLNECKKYNARVRIVTNLNIDNTDKLNAISESNVELCVSCDSPRKQDYEEIRYPASFDLFCKNLEYISKRVINPIKIFMTLDNNNIDQIIEMVDFIDKFGIKKLYIWQRFLEKNDPNSLEGKKLDNCSFFKKAFDYAKVKNIEIRVLSWPYFNQKEYSIDSVCVKPWMSIHINHDGSIGMCDFNECPNDLQELNIKKMDFNSIWNSEQYITLRKKMISQKFIKFCSECCISRRFVDFEDDFYPPMESKIVSNLQNTSWLF